MDFLRKLFGQKPDESAQASRPETMGLPIVRVKENVISFLASFTLAEIKGTPLRTGQFVILLFKDAASAQDAEAKRKRVDTGGTIPPHTITLFSDGFSSLEYTFETPIDDAGMLAFCKLFERAGVQNCLLKGCTQDTQRQILNTFGMKQGLGF